MASTRSSSRARCAVRAAHSAPQSTLAHAASSWPGMLGLPCASRAPSWRSNSAAHLGPDPRRGVHAVGDGFHLGRRRRVLQGQANAAPHLFADRAVQLADAVAARRAAQRQDGHREAFPGRVGLAAPAPHELFVRQPELLAIAVEVGLDQVRRERVVARGDRRVGGEGQVRRDLQRGLVEVLRGAGGQALARQLEAQERRVALVHVQHVGLRVGRQNGAQRAQAADAEHDLLANARVLVAAVQVAGDPAVVLAVVGQVGVEQVQRHATDLGQPDAGRRCGPGTARRSTTGAPCASSTGRTATASVSRRS